MDLSFRDKVARHFKARPLLWIDGRDFEAIGGTYAWRSRISDCRTDLHMRIENRQRRVRIHSQTFIVSEYRYVPPEQPTLFGALADATGTP